jgi:tetratricopeptide (TPR) repeat protein
MICRPDPRPWLAAAAALALGAPATAETARDLLTEARAALDRGDGIAAEVEARRALGEGADRDAVAAYLGEAELLQGDLRQARSWLGPRQFSADSRARGFHALGRLEAIDGNLDAAGQAYDAALKAGPETARLWVDIGRLRYLSGQHGLALGAADRAMALDSADPRALEFRGQLLRDAQGPVAAAAWFEAAVHKAPGDIGLLGEYAASLGEAGRHREMLAVARNMVERDPRHPRAYFLQAVLAARAGNDNLARRLLARTDGAYDAVPAGQLLSGVLELRTGNAALAVDRFDALVRREPDNTAASLLLGRALLANGEANEVVARFAAWADRGDASPYLLTLVGRALEQLGRRAEAAGYLDRAAGDLPQVVGILPGGQAVTGKAAAAVPVLRDLLAQGRIAEARARSNALRSSFPDSADVARVAGDVAFLTGDPASALAEYRRAGAVRRDLALTRRMAPTLRALGRDEQALRVTEDYIGRNPRDGAAAGLLGRIYAAREDWRRAAPLLAFAGRVGGGSGDPRLLAELAVAQALSGEQAAAAETARRAYALQRANGRVAGVLARIMRESGQSREADVLLAKARQRDTAPASPAR